MLTPEQVEQRKSYCMGSDAPIICGVSPYCTPYQLWEYKTRRAIEPDISEKPSVKAGNMLEGAVRDWLANEIEMEIRHDNQLVRHLHYPFMAGNLDGWVVGQSAIVEIKTSSSDKGWGPSGSSIIPTPYLLQISHYMACADVECCYVGVLIRGIDFRWYKIQRDNELISYIIAQEQLFYACMTNDTPPPFQNVEDIVALMASKNPSGAIQATDDLQLKVEKLGEIRALIKSFEEQEQILKLGICEFMNDKEYLAGQSGEILVSWKKSKDSKRLDLDVLKGKFPEIYEQCTKVVPGSRRFDLKK